MIAVSRNNKHQFDETQAAGQRTLLWVGLGSVAMLFAAFTSAYIVQRATGKWVNFPIPSSFMISSFLILVVSLFMQLAYNNAKKSNQGAVKMFLVLTSLAILAFAGSQFYSWTVLVDLGIYAIDQTSVSGPFLYIISGVHGVHVIGGLVALLIMLIRVSFKEMNKKMVFGLQLCNTYVHVIGIVWLYLHIFLVINQNF